MEKDEILQFFLKERGEASDLRDEINKDLGEKQIGLGKQKMELFKFMPILSGGVLGFLSFLGQPNVNLYLYLGVIEQLFLIFFTPAYLRESLDQDINGLQKLQDKYYLLLEEKIKLAGKFLVAGIGTEAALRQYDKEVLGLPGVKELNDDVKKADYLRRNRHEQDLYYGGEFIVFLFISGLLFLVASIFGWSVNSLGVTLIILSSLILSFTSLPVLVVKYVSKIVTFMKGSPRKKSTRG